MIKYIRKDLSQRSGAGDMKNKKEAIKSEMIERIRSGGAWFTTRKDKYVKIGFSGSDGQYFARECFLKEGMLEGGAYSYGTDWFDISFHGRYIDIYADPDTFKEWPVTWTSDHGTGYKGGEECTGQAERVLKFCRRADAEALAGIRDAYQINGTNFDHIISVIGRTAD